MTQRKRQHSWERGPNLPVPSGYTVIRLDGKQYPMKIEKTPIFHNDTFDLPLLQQALAREREQAEAANDTARVKKLIAMQRLFTHLGADRPDLFSEDEITLHTLRDEQNEIAAYSVRVYAVQFLARYAPPDTTSER